ncbi:MAG: glutathione S-transferase N-terminal domain-containing protein [Pseudomonadota bacterium]
MIEFYYWPTPNGWKVAMMLEELGVAYKPVPVNISKGDQFAPAFLAISPNNRMPAIVDHTGGVEPVTVFESGAILWYLAEKTGRFMSRDPIERKETMEWLFWQVGGQGPMAGQLSHFVNYAPAEKRDYGQTRYAGEYDRLLGVLDRRLEGRDWIVGDAYSIADMICWPWVLIAKPLGADLAPFANVRKWRTAIKERPATQTAVNLGKEFRRTAPPDDEERKLLFEQSSHSLPARD